MTATAAHRRQDALLEQALTVIDSRFADANAWGDAQGFGADDCCAKRLTSDGGYEGNTKHRG